jgi:parallel beta-helix repeat protein
MGSLRWVWLGVAIAACSSGSPAATSKDAGTREGSLADGSACHAFTTSSGESAIAGAIATSKDGDCFTFAAGTYAFDNQLVFGTGNDVTMTGAGIGKTIFDFSRQVAGDDGIFVQSVKNLTLRSFSVQNTPGNAIKALGVTGLTFDTLGVSWSGKDPSQHGAYGLYPVECTNVLIESSQISGGSDSGIYVGQSQQIVVRDNVAFENVAGIEIENSYYADVYGNTAHDNTAGILVFSLPGLQQEGGHDIRVYDNTIVDNNTKNFASKGDIVSILPSGTGSFVMACDHVEVFGNTFKGNKTGSLAIISFLDAQLPVDDKKYYPYSTNVFFDDDTFAGNGGAPDVSSTFGLLLATAFDAFPNGRDPDVFYDGVVDPTKKGSNPMQICIQEPHANAVCDLHLDELNSSQSNLAKITTCSPPVKPPLFDCTPPTRVAPVKFAGLTP